MAGKEDVPVNYRTGELDSQKGKECDEGLAVRLSLSLSLSLSLKHGRTPYNIALFLKSMKRRGVPRLSFRYSASLRMRAPTALSLFSMRS